MIGLASLLFHVHAARFKSREWLEAGNTALHQQLIVLARRAPKRLPLTNTDRLIFYCLNHIVPALTRLLARESAPLTASDNAGPGLHGDGAGDRMCGRLPSCTARDVDRAIRRGGFG